MSSRFSVLMIAEQHVSAFKNASKGTMVYDACAFVVFPVVLGVACWISKYSFIGLTESLVSGISILTALMCATAVALFQLRVQLRESKDRFVNNRDRELIDQTFFNVLWAIVVGLILATLLVVADLCGWLSSQFDFAPILISAVVAAVGAHFVLTVFMCLKRLARAYIVIGAHKR